MSQEGTQWKLYVGPSLTDPDEAPLVIDIDEAAARRLEAGDPYLWAGLLSSVQEFVDDEAA